MERKKEFLKIKELIKNNYDNGGLFDTRNIAGDTMKTIFKGKYFTLDICEYYGYFEIFGTTKEEFTELKKYYIGLEKDEKLKKFMEIDDIKEQIKFLKKKLKELSD